VSYFNSRYEFGDFVHIDGDDLVGRVTGFCWQANEGHTVQVSWLHSGDAKVAWIQDWRLSPSALRRSPPIPPLPSVPLKKGT
jgi:hypothetical protein